MTALGTWMTALGTRMTALRTLAQRPRRTRGARSDIGGPRASSEDRRIVGDSRRLLVLGRRGAFFNPQVLDICAAEDDVLVELLGRRDELVGIVLAMLGAERPHIFEGDGRVIRVDAVEGAGIANIAPGDEGDSGSDEFRHLEAEKMSDEMQMCSAECGKVGK